ncbi:MAG TPA: phospho-N-acetylmuramoyl-pentapeptide-transferase [Candidatus Saccharimonadales bacterium]|nr:phospho-N-acetylmuramoyl-pentapeptide-transferase [Candidatus Saccharimonadales bacterium]
MFYHLALAFKSHFSALNMVHYISFRALMGLLTTFFLFLAFGDRFIDFSRKAFVSTARPYTPQSHQEKGSTPTMGGLFILLVVLLNLFLWCDLSKPEVYLFSLTLVLFGGIGLLDDMHKVWYKKGICVTSKFSLQLLSALAVAICWIWFKNPSTQLCVPLFKHFHPDLGWLLVPWVLLVLVGTSNAVNLTDGLDGLAIGSLLLNFAFFSGVAYLAGHASFASYLQIPFTGCSEAVIVGGILIGASLGFLWFNAHPAQIFMGDVGSLSLGAVLALMAIISKQELLLPIAGGMFVIEALSVIMQIGSVKLLGKRLFKMAPIHHHFEVLGWKETKVTMRFNIITLILCLLAAITFKIR